MESPRDQEPVEKQVLDDFFMHMLVEGVLMPGQRMILLSAAHTAADIAAVAAAIWHSSPAYVRTVCSDSSHERPTGIRCAARSMERNALRTVRADDGRSREVLSSEPPELVGGAPVPGLPEHRLRRGRDPVDYGERLTSFEEFAAWCSAAGAVDKDRADTLAGAGSAEPQRAAKTLADAIASRSAGTDLHLPFASRLDRSRDGEPNPS